jgi:beta-phosphoglucomutase-like phosphatase (HAD superfamily)
MTKIPMVLFPSAGKSTPVAPEFCLVIEDSIYGITAAKNAGMICFQFTDAQLHKPSAQADFVFNRYTDVLAPPVRF